MIGEEQSRRIGWALGADMRIEMRGTSGYAGSETCQCDQRGHRLVPVVRAGRHTEPNEVAAHVGDEHGCHPLEHKRIDKASSSREGGHHRQRAGCMVLQFGWHRRLRS